MLNNNNLYIFGDSFSVCREIKPGHKFYETYKEGRTLPWPELIANKFKKQLINYSTLGASYDKILTMLLVKQSSIEENSTIIISGTSSLRSSIPTRAHEVIDPLFDYAGNWDLEEFRNTINQRNIGIKDTYKFAENFADYTLEIKSLLKSELTWYYDNLLFSILEFLRTEKKINYIFWNWQQVYKSPNYNNITQYSERTIIDSHLSYTGNYTLYENLLTAYKNKCKFLHFDQPDEYFNLKNYKIFNKNN